MASRCSFCGTWNDDSVRRCADCGKPFGSALALWQRMRRGVLLLTGAALVGLTLIPVSRPFTDPRAAHEPSSIILFVAGVAVAITGMLRR